MSNKNKYKGFEPKWYGGMPPLSSYRSLFKWGNASYVVRPSESLYTHLKERLVLTDEYFNWQGNLGLNTVDDSEGESKLSKKDIAAFIKIVGESAMSLDARARVSSDKKTYLQNLILRKEHLYKLSDVVLYPTTLTQIREIFDYCNQRKLTFNQAGDESGNYARVTVNLRNYNKIIEINEVNQTITVQAGITGPELEETLNNAPDYFLNVKRKFTCGFFPDEFEYVSVAEWYINKYTNQNSTFYGDIDDLTDNVQKFESEYGTIIASLTFKLWRFTPEERKYFAFVFRDWESAYRASREIMQLEAQHPSALLVCDPEDTTLKLKQFGINGKAFKFAMDFLQYFEGKRCMILGYTDGNRKLSRVTYSMLSKTCKHFGGRNITGKMAQKWERNRYNDAYLRECLLDYDITMDGIDSTVGWNELPRLHNRIMRYTTARKNMIFGATLNNLTSQGCTLQAKFIGKFDSIQDYEDFAEGMRNVINTPISKWEE